jgi:small-conductance mechanosensitive channel
VFLLASVEILGLSQVASFLKAIVNWLPNVVVAAAIFVVAVIVADFAERLVKAIVGKMEIGYTRLLGGIVRYSIWIFAFLAILAQLGIVSEIIQILVAGFVALLVISSSIAFGLGGKDLAHDILENLRTKLRD